MYQANECIKNSSNKAIIHAVEISEEQGLGYSVKGCHCLGEVPQEQPLGVERREEGSIPEFRSQLASIHGL